MKEWVVTIYYNFGTVEIRCESINNALHVIKARREIFPGSIYKLAHKEYKKMIYNYYNCNYCGNRCSDKNMVQTRSGRKLIKKYYCDECVTAFKASCKPVKTIEINLPDELEGKK